MQRFELIERRVLARLKVMSEAGKKKPASKGEWNDIDDGKGGSIYNRRTPTKRGPNAEQRRTAMSKRYDEAAEKWLNMPVSERLTFLASEAGGYEREDRIEMARQSWARLIEDIGGPESQEARDLVSAMLHWELG
jgi:hypothetical protein